MDDARPTAAALNRTRWISKLLGQEKIHNVNSLNSFKIIAENGIYAENILWIIILDLPQRRDLPLDRLGGVKEV
jgi:hypothetical protein